MVDLGANYHVVTIKITDLSGKLIHSQAYNHTQMLNLNLTALAGVYLLTILSEERRAVVRVLRDEYYPNLNRHLKTRWQNIRGEMEAFSYM